MIAYTTTSSIFFLVLFFVATLMIVEIANSECGFSESSKGDLTQSHFAKIKKNVQIAVHVFYSAASL